MDSSMTTTRNTIERIERIALRNYFRSESSDFTPWLAGNLDIIGEAIHRKLLNPSTEQTSENFRVDIQAEQEDGSDVVIENQFGDSNHDHLGKIITYRTAFNAKLAIWIVENAKQEHIDAINWLNETDNGCEFFLLELKLIRIGASSLGPLFMVKSAPATELRERGNIRRDETRRHEMRFKFWTRLLDVFKSDRELTAFKRSNPTKDSFISSGAGIAGVQWMLWLTKDSIRCELRIDRGKDAEEENLTLLHKLAENKTEVDTAYGCPLNWDEMEGYRTTAIRTEFRGGYDFPDGAWNDIIAEDLKHTKRFVECLKKPVEKLRQTIRHNRQS